MRSRAPLAQRGDRGAWGSTRTAALLPALAVLLGALLMCLGHGTHGVVALHPAPTAVTVSPGQPTADGTAAHPAGRTVFRGVCPAGGSCCVPAVHAGGAVLAAPVQTAPALLRRVPGPPTPPDTPALPTGRPPPGAAPDLHVLQVQRT
ncbi:hypothetical protein [Streptomyces phaeofaciens]|uniref:hypothetical protein n=1 Tax=Streptomyces phaeofaciens TaxID=68254 RepID=UPI003673C4AE